MSQSYPRDVFVGGMMGHSMFDPQGINAAARRQRSDDASARRSRQQQQDDARRERDAQLARATEHEGAVYEICERFRRWAISNRIRADHHLGWFTFGWEIASYEQSYPTRADDVSSHTYTVSIILTRGGRFFAVSVSPAFKRELSSVGVVSLASVRSHIIKYAAKSNVPWE